MTTKSPLIRRVGSGYSASWNGFHVYDEDLQRVLARVAELVQSANPDERGASNGSAELRRQDRDSAGATRTASE